MITPTCLRDGNCLDYVHSRYVFNGYFSLGGAWRLSEGDDASFWRWFSGDPSFFLFHIHIYIAQCYEASVEPRVALYAWTLLRIRSLSAANPSLRSYKHNDKEPHSSQVCPVFTRDAGITNPFVLVHPYPALTSRLSASLPAQTTVERAAESLDFFLICPVMIRGITYADDL